jgi:DNA polymerase III delta subunit
MLYLFLGQDHPAKDAQLKKIKQEFLPAATEQFNLDILYGRELTLKNLQERLLCLPTKGTKRIILVKAAEGLREELRGFLLRYALKPYRQVILILDLEEYDRRSVFLTQLTKYAKVLRFKQRPLSDTFSLCRLISARRPAYALGVLHQLLQQGERPERILGGLRYAWEKETLPSQEMRRRLKLILNCDIEIKTGRLKPAFSLEKLVVALCHLGKPAH